MSEDRAAASLRALRGRREQVREIARFRHAANPAVLVSDERPDATAGGDDRVQLVVDFDDEATLLDQVGLRLDLADLLHREIPVRSRRSVAEVADAAGYLEPL